MGTEGCKVHPLHTLMSIPPRRDGALARQAMANPPFLATNSHEKFPQIGWPGGSPAANVATGKMEYRCVFSHENDFKPLFLKGIRTISNLFLVTRLLWLVV